MGENLALNIESRGFSVAGFDLDSKKVDSFASRTQGKKAIAARTQAEFLACLESPRKILVMVPAGKAVDAVIASLRPQLAAGDLLMDGGNTLFSDTVRRLKELEGTGILFIGTPPRPTTVRPVATGLGAAAPATSLRWSTTASSTPTCR